MDIETAHTHITDRHARLDELSGLKEGWCDGDGSAISAAAIVSAKALLNMRPELAQICRIYPLLDGGIQLEMGGAQIHCEILIGTDGKVDIECLRDVRDRVFQIQRMDSESPLMQANLDTVLSFELNPTVG